MNTILHIANAAKDLDPFLEIIKKSYTSAIKKITAKMPVSNVDVIVANNPYEVIPEIGMGGRTYNAHLVVISIDVNSQKLKDNSGSFLSS